MREPTRVERALFVTGALGWAFGLERLMGEGVWAWVFAGGAGIAVMAALSLFVAVFSGEL